MLEEGAARQTLEVEAPLTEAGSVAVHPGVGEGGVGRQHPQGSGGRGAGAAGLCRGGPGREEGAVERLGGGQPLGSGTRKMARGGSAEAHQVACW